MIDEDVLTAFYKQNTMQTTVGSEYTLIEEFKGPYATANSFVAHCKAGDSRSSVIGRMPIVEEISAPNPPNKTRWVLSQISLTEVEAGLHGIVRCEFKAAKDEEEEATHVKSVSLAWQSYSQSTLAFCANKPQHNDNQFAADPAPDTQTALADHIKNCLDHLDTRLSAAHDNLGYTPNEGLGDFQLNKRETAIAKKMMSGIQFATYHRPVQTYVEESKVLSTDWKNDNPWQDVIGSEVDCIITTKPTGFIEVASPVYDSSVYWLWVCVTDNANLNFSDNLQKNHIWTRTRVFEGSIAPDVNFYGTSGYGALSGRWKVGGM